MVEFEFDEEHANWLRPHAREMGAILTEKARRYIDHPSEAPAWAEVHEGPQGGYYYFTTEEDAEEEPEEPDEEESEEDDQEERKVPTFDDMPNTEEHDPIPRDEAMDLDTGEKVWALGPDGMVLAEVVQGEEYRGLSAQPVGGDVEDAFSIYPETRVFGLASEEAVEEWLEINPEVDDLTGQVVQFENGQRGWVAGEEGDKLTVDIFDDEDSHYDTSDGVERIYGIDRDTVQSIVDDEVDDDFGEGWLSVSPDDTELGEEREWIKEHGYSRQTLKVHDKATGEIKQGFIKPGDYNPQRGTAYVQMEEGGREKFLFGSSNRFEVVGAQEFDSLSPQQKLLTIRDTIQHTSYRSIDSNTERKILDNFVERSEDDPGSLTSAKSWDTALRVAEGLRYVKNEVSRASCGGSRGSGSYHIKVSKDEDDDTIAHELGHGIATTFGYDYEGENATEDYGPWDLSHNYSQHAGDWDSYIDWDFSEDSKFFDPSEYMFTKWNEDADPENYAVGFDDFKEDVEQEVQSSFGEITGADQWGDLEYETPDSDASAQQVFESLKQGDVVQFRVPDWDQGRDDDGNPLGHKADYAKFSHFEPQLDSEGEPMEGHKIAFFERADGDEWQWPVGPDGELYSNWSSVESVATDTDTREQTGGTQIPVGAGDSESVGELLAESWSGFRPDAETQDEKFENLARAINRSWYKQAKVHETTDEGWDRQKVVMETGYSATNAHETMAQLHEVMQTPEYTNRGRASQIAKEHPWLVLAYLDLWDPHPVIREDLEHTGLSFAMEDLDL